MFFTFYDHLEEFMSLGLLLESEKLIVPQNIQEHKAVINEATQNEDIDSETRSSHFSPAPANKLSKLIEIRNLSEFDKYQLIELIERRCLDLTQQLYLKYLSCATIQKEIAYAIIVVARQENNILNADNNVLRELYGVSIRNEAEFKSTIETLSVTLPNNSLNLQFDLVIREYTEEGLEIVPGMPHPHQVPSHTPQSNIHSNINQSPTTNEQILASQAQNVPPQLNYHSIVRIDSKRDHNSNQIHIQDDSRNQSLSRQIVQAGTMSREPSVERHPLAKIKIDSEPLVKQLVQQANTSKFRTQDRDSATSNNLLNYNFDASIKSRALVTNNIPLRQKAINSVNQSNSNSKATLDNLVFVYDLSNNDTSKEIKSKTASKMLEPLTFAQPQGIRHLSFDVNNKIKKIDSNLNQSVSNNNNNTSESQRQSITSNIGGVVLEPPGRKQTTRIIGDNNHRLSIPTSKDDVGQDNRFPTFNSMSKLNIYSGQELQNTGIDPFEYDFKLNSGSNKSEYKLFNSSFNLTKDEADISKGFNNRNNEDEYSLSIGRNAQGSFINDHSNQKGVGSGSNLGQRLEKLKAKITLGAAIKKPNEELETGNDTSRSRPSSNITGVNLSETFKIFQDQESIQIKNYDSSNPLNRNMKSSLTGNKPSNMSLLQRNINMNPVPNIYSSSSQNNTSNYESLNKVTQQALNLTGIKESISTQKLNPIKRLAHPDQLNKQESTQVTNQRRDSSTFRVQTQPPIPVSFRSSFEGMSQAVNNLKNSNFMPQPHSIANHQGGPGIFKSPTGQQPQSLQSLYNSQVNNVSDGIRTSELRISYGNPVVQGVNSHHQINSQGLMQVGKISGTPNNAGLMASHRVQQLSSFNNNEDQTGKQQRISYGANSKIVFG